MHRWTDAFPQYRPGHLDRVAATEAALAAADPRVALAGMHLRGVGIPACVAGGAVRGRPGPGRTCGGGLPGRPGDLRS